MNNDNIQDCSQKGGIFLVGSRDTSHPTKCTILVWFSVVQSSLAAKGCDSDPPSTEKGDPNRNPWLAMMK